jgi:aspartyl/asparaginyl beta-hydroxylase (cupin superfamily)
VRGSPQSGRPDVFFHIGPEWYKGSEPPFYDTRELPAARILEEAYPDLKEEIERRYAERQGAWQPNYTPYAYSEPGWKTVNLFSYFLEYPRAIAQFPVTAKVVRSIPGMCLAQIAVLEPHTRIKAHFGDTDAVIRTHLGIRVPGKLPELGIRVGREERAWREGETFAIQIAHRHYAWNRTDAHRIALVVDVVRPELWDRRYALAGKALAAIAMKHVATRRPATRRLPRPLVRALHAGLGRGFQARLWAQRTFRV